MDQGRIHPRLLGAVLAVMQMALAVQIILQAFGDRGIVPSKGVK